MKTNIKGVGVALITPFNDNGDVDFEALERLLDRVAAGGADYLVVLGTTAETPTLSAAEKEAVTKFHRKQKRRPDAGCDRDQR